MLNIKQIQYFAACAKTGSFSQAAELLFTTQSNVSKVIRSMEDDMRTQLFVRHAKGIELTPEGERAFIHVQRILENIDELEMQAQPLAKSSLCVCFHPKWAQNIVRGISSILHILFSMSRTCSTRNCWPVTRSSGRIW